jgi:hypothetical protein
MTELLSSVDWARWMGARPPRHERQAIPPELRLQQIARWSAPGGRRYALYGRVPTDWKPT